MTDTQDLRPHIRAALEAGDKSGGVMATGGWDVTIYAVNGMYIHGHVEGDALAMTWSRTGEAMCKDPTPGFQLIPRPAPKRRVKGWVNVNEVYQSKEDADEAERRSDYDRIACIEIDVEEGEGL